MNNNTRNAVKAGAYTALWTFVGLFGLSLAGWLNDVQQWATSDGAVTVFPDPSVLVKAAVAAVSAAAGGLVGLVVRLVQAAAGSDSLPKYQNPPA